VINDGILQTCLFWIHPVADAPYKIFHAIFVS